MTIKTRLIALAVIIDAMLAVSLVLLNSQAQRVELIREEQILLSGMQEALANESLALMDLLLVKHDSGIRRYTELGNATSDAFKHAREEIRELPGLGHSVREALKSAFRLNAMLEDRRAELLFSAQKYSEVIDRNYPYTGDVPLFRIVTDDAYRNESYQDVLNAVNAYISTQTIVLNTMSSSMGILSMQIKQIDNSIMTIAARQAFYMNAGIGFVILFSFVFSILNVRIILSRVKKFRIGILGLSTGDLTSRISTKGRDELGELGGRINDFVDRTKDTLASIQNEARSNADAGAGLLSAVEDAADSSEQGEQYAASIMDLSGTLDDSVRDSAEAVERIVGRVDDFVGMIRSQAAMVEQSTAAMVEMTASLTSMAKVLNNNREAAETLDSSSREGHERISKTSGIIHQVGGHVNAIQEMADLIKGVADQTNLLAMNAAIEAAHAGEAGRGFGVVADEIRKLAEATAENSRIISENLRAIIKDITEANQSSSQAVDSFQAIEDEVSGVLRRTAEVTSSIEEISQGGTQVMQAMNELRDYTSRVSESTVKITEDIHSVRNSVNVASDVSRQVSSGSREIREGLAVITQSTERTRGIAASITQIGENLETVSRSFKVDEHDRRQASGQTGAVRPAGRENLPAASQAVSASMPSAEEGVTLSEGEWPGRDEITIVNERGRPESD